MSVLAIPRRLAWNAVRALRRVGARGALPERGGWVVVRLGAETDELRAPPIAFGREPALALLDVLLVLDAAARDARVDGVVLRLEGGLPGWSAALALRRAVDALRAAGKRVVAWGEVLSSQEILVATGADRVWLPETGQLFLVGLQVEQLYLRDLLSHVDVEPEVVRVGAFKSAGELLTRRSMSPEQREQLERWQGDLFEVLVGGIARGRGLEASEVRDRIDRGPYPAPAAVEAGLIDGCLYADELEERLEALAPAPPAHAPGPRRPRLVEDKVYFALHAGDPGWRPLLRDLPSVAYVVASGSIHRGGGLRGVASETYRELLASLREEGRVRGVVLRVDSPGGDAAASDLLFRAVERLAREKPVVVSMGDVAASGGYFLAAGADCVLAETGTLTGSIGVVGGKLNVGGLYQRLGIAKESVEHGARAGLLSEARGFTPDERRAVRREMEAIYATFLARVGAGRRMSVEAVRRVAGGRLWSGHAARGAGLVDAIGGPLEALAELRRRAAFLPGERFRLEMYPRRPALPDLRSLLGLRALR